MAARMDDTIHVQVEVVKLYVIGIGLTGVHWNLHAIYNLGLQQTTSTYICRIILIIISLHKLLCLMLDWVLYIKAEIWEAHIG